MHVALRPSAAAYYMEFHSRWPSESEFASGDRTHRIKNERWMVYASHRDARITTRAALRVKRTDLSRSRTKLSHRHRRACRFQLSTDRLSCRPAAVGVRSAAADHPQATRRNVLIPAAQEFPRRQLHAFLDAVAVIAELEHHVTHRHRSAVSGNMPRTVSTWPMREGRTKRSSRPSVFLSSIMQPTMSS